MQFCSPLRVALLAPVSLVLMTLGSGCKAESRATGPVEPTSRAHSSGNLRPTPTKPVSEEVETMLSAVAAACRTGDAKGFLDAFVRSGAVRNRYSAADIAYSVRAIVPAFRIVSEERIPAAAYHHKFPIRMEDYYYKSTLPIRLGDKDEYVMLEINQSQSNQLSVEWTRVHFDGQSEGGDDLGKAYTLDGAPYEKGSPNTDGQLLFEPTANCWQLVSDIRHQSRGN